MLSYLRANPAVLEEAAFVMDVAPEAVILMGKGDIYGEGAESLPRIKVADRPRHNDLLNWVVHVLGVRTVWLERDRRPCAPN